MTAIKLMNGMAFVERVKRYFGYLESEYGFKITLERDSDIRPQTDGVVTYTSDTTVVVIDSETGYAAIKIARVQDGERYYLTPIDIYAYLNTSAAEKKILLSTDPRDEYAASTLFRKKFILNQPGWEGDRGTVEDLEKELENFSNLLKTYADLCLKGDFSQWPAFYEYKVYRMRADHLRNGRDELCYAEVKDADGNSRLIKQSIFKDILARLYPNEVSEKA